MAGGGDHGHIVQSDLLGHRREERPQHRPRRDDLPQDARGNAQPLQHVARPIAGPGIVELAGGRLRELADLASSEPEVEEIGHHQQPLGRLQLGGVAEGHGQELVQGVELHELDARALEDFLAGDAAEGFLHHAVGSGVAVVVGVADEPIVAIQQGEVHPPGVQPHGGQAGAELLDARLQTALHLGEKAQHVPMEVSQHTHRPIGEAMHLLQPEPVSL